MQRPYRPGGLYRGYYSKPPGLTAEQEDFKARATERPRINTAEDLYILMAGLGYFPREAPYKGYQFAAAAPCHPSKDPTTSHSFQFGNDPAGRLIIGCWSCDQQIGWVSRIEDNLGGVALQVVKPDGQLRYGQPGDKPWEPGPYQKAYPYEAKPTELHCQVMPAGFTLADLYELPCWFVGAGKQGHTFEWAGQSVAWQQSVADSLNPAGMALCQKGGPAIRMSGRTVLLKPWTSLAACRETIQWLKAHKQDGKYGLRPSLGLGGDKESPAISNALVLDFDYRPDSDSEGQGKVKRDSCLDLCRQAGLPIFASNSGNGFHALALLDKADLILTGKAKQGNHQLYPALSVDLFLPSSRFLVALNPDKPLHNADLDHCLPVLTLEQVYELRAGKDAQPVNDLTGNCSQCGRPVTAAFQAEAGYDGRCLACRLAG